MFEKILLTGFLFSPLLAWLFSFTYLKLLNFASVLSTSRTEKVLWLFYHKNFALYIFCKVFMNHCSNLNRNFYLTT